MAPDEKDHFLEEVDQELRSISTRLKKVLSKTEAVLKEHCRDTQETEGSGADEQEKDEG
jgi:hypothetical protein